LYVKDSSIFGKWKTVNRFPNLNSTFLQARLLEPSTAGHWSLLVARIYRRRFPFTKLRRQNPGTFGYCRRIPTTRFLESGQSWFWRMWPKFGTNGRWLFFAVVIFLYKPNAKKLFWKNYFFLKMISSKIFYDGNNFTSKQTEHKIWG